MKVEIKNKVNHIKEPFLKHDIREFLNATDIYTISILSIYTILALIYFQYIVDVKVYIFMNLFIISSIVTIAIVETYLKAGRVFTFIRYFYVIPLIFLIYSQVQIYIPVINPYLYDKVLIRWDYLIFRTNPTQFLSHLANPYLTMYLQLSYMLYFFMPLYVGAYLIYKGRIEDYYNFIAIMSFGFFFSYLMYFALPAVGPRFMLHDFSRLNIELPGFFITDFFRDVVNIGGGIKEHSINPVIDVNRDCMPSGHTMLTIVNILMAKKYKVKFRGMIYLFGISLIFATIYLRYHYVVDLIAGGIFAILVLNLEPKVRKYLNSLGFKFIDY